MTDDRTFEDGMDDHDVMAAELALDLLDGDERATAMRRVLAEPDFAREVDAWRTRFAQLFVLWPEMDAPDGLHARVEQSLDGPVSAPIADVVPIRAAGRFWPALAVVSTLIAASLLLVILLRPTPPVPTTNQIATQEPVTPAPRIMLVAAIDPGKEGAPVSAVYDPASGGLRVAEASLSDAKSSAELWVIAGDGVPHALGLLSTTGNSVFVVNADNKSRMGTGSTLAISIEPLGGSPTDLPTGPVVATGALSQV